MANEYDMQAFIEDHKGKIFRYWKYKHPGVSYDYGDGEEPGPYEDEHCSFGRLISAVTLPGYDLLLCFEDDLSGGKCYRTYVKLSEVDISYSDNDQEDEDE